MAPYAISEEGIWIATKGYTTNSNLTVIFLYTEISEKSVFYGVTWDTPKLICICSNTAFSILESSHRLAIFTFHIVHIRSIVYYIVYMVDNN